MINCTKHFLERWTERILGITTEKEVNNYISMNRDMLIENANKTFEYAEFIYKGQIGDNITRNFYIKDDIVFVVNTTNDAMITVYKVDLGFTKELNSTVRRGLIEEVHKLTKEKDEVEFQILLEVEGKEHKVFALDDEIRIVTEQLNNLKKQREFEAESIKNIKSKSANVGLDVKKYTMMLVNSKEYKKDLLSMKTN